MSGFYRNVQARLPPATSARLLVCIDKRRSELWPSIGFGSTAPHTIKIRLLRLPVDLTVVFCRILPLPEAAA